MLKLDSEGNNTGRPLELCSKLSLTNEVKIQWKAQSFTERISKTTKQGVPQSETFRKVPNISLLYYSPASAMWKLLLALLDLQMDSPSFMIALCYITSQHNVFWELNAPDCFTCCFLFAYFIWLVSFLLLFFGSFFFFWEYWEIKVRASWILGNPASQIGTDALS